MPPQKSVTLQILQRAAKGQPVELLPPVEELLGGLVNGGYVIVDVNEDVVHPRLTPKGADLLAIFQ